MKDCEFTNNVNQRITEINEVISNTTKTYILVILISFLALSGNITNIPINDITININEVVLFLLPFLILLILYRLINQIFYRNYLVNLIESEVNKSNKDYPYMIMSYSALTLGLLVRSDPEAKWTYRFLRVMEILVFLIMTSIPLVSSIMYCLLVKKYEYMMIALISFMYIVSFIVIVGIKKVLK